MKIYLLQTDLCILNNQSPTYLSQITFKTSSVDLSLCSPLLAPSLKWSTLEDTHHSDHFPITIKNNLPTISEIPDKLNFKKANWEQFQEHCRDKLNIKTENKTIEFFTEKLLEITENNIPKLSTKPRKNQSWFNKKI